MYNDQKYYLRLKMKKIAISIDYNNICKNYNTVYLDRDNTDRETSECMKKVMNWISEFLAELNETFSYKIYRMNSDSILSMDEIARKRFLFYSLEKEMLAQTFIFESSHINYETLNHWIEHDKNSVVIKNDDEGEGLHFYMNDNSEMHIWMLDKLKDFALDISEVTKK